MGAATKEETPDIGVTIEGDINRILQRIKDKTGLSVSRLANIGLSFLGPRILAGEFVVLNGAIVAAAPKETKK